MDDAETVRNAVANITGLDRLGIVMRRSTSDDVFMIARDLTRLRCLRDGPDWEIALFDDNAKTPTPAITWSTKPPKTISPIGTFVSYLLQLETEPRYRRYMREIAPDIARHWFETERGDVVVHTRRREPGNEIVVEMVRDSRYVQFLHNLTRDDIPDWPRNAVRKEATLTERPF